MNEQDLFLEETNPNDLFAPEEVAEEPTESETTPEEDEQKLRNRRERRLAAKLQAERESSIALAARLEAITEAKGSKEEADYLKSIERIYGTDTPEAATATDLLKNALTGLREDVKRETMDQLREEQAKLAQETKAEEASLDQMIEDIEDEFGVALTKEQQRGYFTLMEKLSPKDSDGNILHYADPIAVYEEYQERVKRSTGNTKAKDLAARSMTASGAGSSNQAADDATQKFLRENGLI